MDSSNAPPARPPEAPAFRRRICLDRSEKIGVPLLVLLPALALTGLFDERLASVTVAAPGLEMQVHYPARTRHHREAVLEIDVRNTSKTSMPRVTIALDRGYLSAFDQLRFLPLPARLDDDFFEVDLRDVQAGETRRLNIELRPDQAGRHTAQISARTGAGVRATSTFSSVIFP